MRRILLCVMMLSGCAPEIQPGAPLLKHVAVPAELIASNPSVKASNGIILYQKWWEAFHDPNLDRLIDIALSDNPSLGEAHARLSKAQAIVTQAASSSLPDIHSAADISRQHNSKNGNHDIYNGKTSTVADLDPLVVNYHPDFWDRDSEIAAAAGASKEMAEAELRQGALAISSNVIKTYFSLLAAIQLTAVQSETVKRSEERAHLLEIAYQAGIQPKISTLSQNVDLLASKAALSDLEKRVDTDRFALLTLLGRSPGDSLPTVSTTLSIPDRFDIPNKIDINLISRRPDIQAALWRVKRQSHLEMAARNAFYPNIDLRAIAGLNSIGLANLLDAGSFAYSFGPAFDLPLFEGGALRGKLHEAESDHDIAVHAYNRAVLESVHQVAMALTAMKNSRIQIDDHTASVSLLASKLAIADHGFRSGVYSKFPYLEAAIEINHERMVCLEATLNFIYGITDLATSLGGGFGSWQG